MCSSDLRDRVVTALGGGPELLLNADLDPGRGSVPADARAIAAIEEARAALAEDLNLNPRLVLEQAFLRLAGEAEGRGSLHR